MEPGNKNMKPDERDEEGHCTFVKIWTIKRLQSLTASSGAAKKTTNWTLLRKKLEISAPDTLFVMT